jgi:hypothetical protein
MAVVRYHELSLNYNGDLLKYANTLANAGFLSPHFTYKIYFQTIKPQVLSDLRPVKDSD